jgi:acetolactate synthase regulatory subunit
VTGTRLHVVRVALRDQNSTHALLSLVSVLHRRAAEVGQADLSPASQGRRIFNATFTATDRQAATVRASLDNLIDVLEVVLAEATETSGVCKVAARSRRARIADCAASNPPSQVSHVAIPLPESAHTQAHRPKDNS